MCVLGAFGGLGLGLAAGCFVSPGGRRSSVVGIIIIFIVIIVRVVPTCLPTGLPSHLPAWLALTCADWLL
jgi:hypothetical protein